MNESESGSPTPENNQNYLFQLLIESWQQGSRLKQPDMKFSLGRLHSSQVLTTTTAHTIPPISPQNKLKDGSSSNWLSKLDPHKHFREEIMLQFFLVIGVDYICLW